MVGVHLDEIADNIEIESFGPQNIEVSFNYHLKKCPFCGSDGIFVFEGGNKYVYYIECASCKVRTPEDSLSWVINGWNARYWHDVECVINDVLSGNTELANKIVDTLHKM